MTGPRIHERRSLPLGARVPVTCAACSPCRGANGFFTPAASAPPPRLPVRGQLSSQSTWGKPGEGPVRPTLSVAGEVEPRVRG